MRFQIQPWLEVIKSLKNNPYIGLLIVSFLVVISLQNARGIELEIFYWGDFHAQNTSAEHTLDGITQQTGGAAALSGLLKSMRQKNMRTLTLDAGDQFTGQPISSLTKGASQIKLLNNLKVDAFVPGNHEFDYGWKSLIEVTEKAKFDILLANVIRIEDNKTLYKPHKVFEIDGLKVAIIGLIYQEFTHSVIRQSVIGLEATDPIIAARQFVENYKNKVDLLIALSHSGWAQDSILANRVPELDMIIGGHSHTVLQKPRIVNTVMITHAGSNGMYLGHMNLIIDTTANAIISYHAELIPVITDSIKADRTVAKLVKGFEKKQSKQLNRKIGTLASDWNERNHSQSNMAQWFADALRNISPRTSLAVINNGNLRKGLKRGKILERDVWEICTIENSIIVIQVTGREIINAVNYLVRSPREFVTWSGLKVVATDGVIISIHINNVPINPRGEYAVITTGYLWDHIKSYLNIVPNPSQRPFFFIPGDQRSYMIEAIEQQKVISKSLDNRWLVE